MNTQQASASFSRSSVFVVQALLVPYALTASVSSQIPSPDGFTPEANAPVASLAVQPDGNIVVAGGIHHLGRTGT